MTITEHSETGLSDYLKEEGDRETVERMYNEIQDKYLWHDNKTETRLWSIVPWLHDIGIEIYSHLGTSRRIVFDGRLNNKDVVIKITSFAEGQDKSQIQQQQEEEIWHKAKADGDQRYFAEILFTHNASECIVQEKCFNPRSFDSEDLPDDYLEMAAKYGIRELQLGEDSNGNLKFVDYGH